MPETSHIEVVNNEKPIYSIILYEYMSDAYNYSRGYDLHNMLKGEGSLCYHNHWLAYQGKD